jgi:hypothetical protein
MSTVGQRLLREAIERVGAEEVCRALNLSAHSLEAFRSGERRVNDAILLKVIDLLDRLPKRDESSRPQQV